MKKIILLIISTLILSACSKETYSSILEKLKSYSGETVIGNNYSSGFYNEQGFMLYKGEIVLYHEGTSSASDGYVFITLPNSTSAPNAYYCLYSWQYFSTSYNESASFYITNSYTFDSSVVFDSYTGTSDARPYAQDLAKSSVDLLLFRFNTWLRDEYNTSLKSIGMFPNFYN